MFITGIIVFAAAMYVFTLVCAGFEVNIAGMLTVDLTTTFAFVAVIIAVIIATGEFKTFIKAFNALLSRRYKISETDRERAVGLFKTMTKAVMCTIALIFTMQLMLVLMNIGSFETTGSYFAVSILSIYQGAFILAIIHIAIHVLKTRRNTEDIIVISEKQVVDKLLELCYKQGIAPEDILEASEINLKKRQ